jgi:hypothetical protein
MITNQANNKAFTSNEDNSQNDEHIPLHQSPSSQSESTTQVAGQVVGIVILE